MPRFDFQCSECSYTFEQELQFGSSELPPCPQCEGATEKLISPPTIHFKGDGFYKTDSKPKPKAPKKEDKKEKAPQKDKKKPSQKTSTDDKK